MAASPSEIKMVAPHLCTMWEFATRLSGDHLIAPLALP